MADTPKIVVLCGSSKFVDIMAVCAWLIEREEQAISMSLHLLPYWYKSPGNEECPDDHLAEAENVAEQMDELHLRKIDLCNEIFIVNFGDYIGESTSREIEYARSKGIPLRWFSCDPIGEIVESMINKNYTGITEVNGNG